MFYNKSENRPLIYSSHRASCEVKNPHHFLASGGDFFFLPFLVLYVKRRAGFSDSKQVAVSEDAAEGETPFQLGHQPVHGFLLFGRSGVGRLSANVQPSLIADADAVGVEAFGMCAHLTQWSAVVHGSIPTEVVVVAASLPACCSRFIRKKRKMTL